ncbi:MAG: insulinase family protein [Bacteroidales bacterium]|jgi:zinc protease|nr:insulinase family protein [Bacteroidales bacterium]
MKKILLSLLVIVLTIPAMAQQMPPLPIDAKVRKGTLPNGLTYYIRQNAEPKGQAEFFIAQKVGSVQEEDNQRGLAHFLEHMAFNGTKNFPGKDLFKFTESIGVKFGYNLNAYTAFDETVYNISSVPLTRTSLIDSCLLVLHDWSAGLTLADKDIDEERGVIREEMRTRSSAMMRILEEMLPDMFPGNRYGLRMPIGTEQVINGFKYDELRDYYKKWYRPDHQAIIVVGDFDPNYVEEKIKTMFADIPAPTTPSELAAVSIEPNEKPIIVLGTDPEMTETGFSINYKYDPLPKEVKVTAQSLIFNFMTNVVTSMLNTRFSEIAQKANAPFLYAGAGTGSFIVAKSMDAFEVSAGSKEGAMTTAFEAVVAEIARVKQHGFTSGEYERSKANYLSSIEKAYKERDKQKSGSIAQECVRNFEDDEPMPGIESEYALMNQVAPMLPLEQINMLAQQFIHDNDLVIYGYGPKKEGVTYPTKEELMSIYEKTMAAPQEAYKDEVSNEPLVDVAQLQAGKVTKTTDVKLFEAKEFTLSNNIKVIIKPTDFKEDEIRFVATSFGGNSLMNEKDVMTIKMLNEIATIGGVGNFSIVNLNKALSGKQVRVNANIGTPTEQLVGNCSPKDLETMMQLVYLYTTAPRFDQEAFDSWMERMKAQLENTAADPMSSLMDTLMNKIYGNQPRTNPVKMDDLSKIDYKLAIELYKERFKDMSDFTFTFVGNIDEATFIPLMEQYIGALPNLSRKETFKDINLNPLKGESQTHFNREMLTVKATVVTVYTGKMDYTPENVMKYSIFQQILNLVYTEEIREKEGGTYGVAVQGQLQRYPDGNYSMLILFDTDPNLADKLLSIVYREMEKIANEGPRSEDFEKTIAYMKKDFEEKRRDNGTWMNAINEYAMYSTDGFTKREQLLETIKPADIQAIAKTLVSAKNRAEVIMKGVEVAK